jgi:parvulin-like peptidyl-prolyl isomerase
MTFSNAARLYSADTITSDRGGELGWFERGSVQDELWEACLRVARGTTTEPVRTEAGYHLLQVMDLETARTRQFAFAMRAAEDRQLHRLRSESDIRLADGFSLRPIELPRERRGELQWPD